MTHFARVHKLFFQYKDLKLLSLIGDAGLQHTPAMGLSRAKWFSYKKKFMIYMLSCVLPWEMFRLVQMTHFHVWSIIMLDIIKAGYKWYFQVLNICCVPSTWIIVGYFYMCIICWPYVDLCLFCHASQFLYQYEVRMYVFYINPDNNMF